MEPPDRRLPQPRARLPQLDPTLIESVFRVTARRRRFIGFELGKRRRARGLSPAAQAAELGITVAALACLCLCKLPRPDREADDMAAIAARVGLPVGRLRELLGAAG